MWETRCSVLLIFSLIFLNTAIKGDGTQGVVDRDDKNRIYDFKKVNGAGCPYTASWLAHVNLYRRVTWYLDSTKMEAASFSIFDTSKLKFQVSDPDSYYVHHMSRYEHSLHKADGYDVAQNKTLILSRTAMMGECNNLNISTTKEYLALIPFFGGRPPGVTKDLKVKSIGQGNSLVTPETKSMQCMATLCSTLKYYGHAVIGVVRDLDKDIIISALDGLHPSIKAHTQIVQLKVPKNANLPFHLLAWGQQYVKDHNCALLSSNRDKIALRRRVLNADNTSAESSLSRIRNEYSADESLMEICKRGGIANPKGSPYNVIYHRPSILHSQHFGGVSANISASSNDSFTVLAAVTDGNIPKTLLKYVYYTECDQIVKYDDMNTFNALSSASNSTCFFVGRRREKIATSDAEDYMGGLDQWRECGTPGFSMSWPQDNVVRMNGN